MHSSGSFLKTVIERIRYYVDEAIVDAKYTDDFLVRHVVIPEYMNVWMRISRNFDNPPMFRTTISLVAQQAYYTLPPNILEVKRLTQFDNDTTQRITREMRPKSEFDPRGPGWSLEGNLISFRPPPGQAADWDLWYFPSGDFVPHYAEDGDILSDTEFQLSLNDSASNLLGDIDRRENAYVGGILRLIPDDPGVVEEHMISAYDASTQRLTLRTPISIDNAPQGSLGDGSIANVIKYEIAPAYSQPLWQAIACGGAMNLMSSKSVSQKQYQFMVIEYKKAIKSAGDLFANMQGRTFKSYEKATVDNRDATVVLLR